MDEPNAIAIAARELGVDPARVQAHQDDDVWYCFDATEAGGLPLIGGDAVIVESDGTPHLVSASKPPSLTLREFREERGGSGAPDSRDP
jgi:hypothetical protein